MTKNVYKKMFFSIMTKNLIGWSLRMKNFNIMGVH